MAEPCALPHLTATPPRATSAFVLQVQLVDYLLQRYSVDCLRATLQSPTLGPRCSITCSHFARPRPRPTEPRTRTNVTWRVPDVCGDGERQEILRRESTPPRRFIISQAVAQARHIAKMCVSPYEHGATTSFECGTASKGQFSTCRRHTLHTRSSSRCCATCTYGTATVPWQTQRVQRAN